MDKNKDDIFDRMRSGEAIPFDDPQYSRIFEVVSRTMPLSAKLNAATNVDQIRNIVSEIIGSTLDKSTKIYIPFYTNFGKFIKIGRNVFINHACSFLDLGGITIEDDVLLGPKVNLITEGPFCESC